MFYNRNFKNYCPKTTNLLMVYFLQSLCCGFTFYLTLFLKKIDELNSEQIGVVLSATLIGNLIGNTFGGFYTDRYNPSYLLKAGLYIQALGLLAILFLSNFYFIFIVILLMGIGSSIYILCTNYILNSKFSHDNKKRTNIISHQFIISNLGMGLASVIMGYLSEGYLNSIFILISVTLFITSIKLEVINKEFYLETNQETSSASNDIKYQAVWYCLVGILSFGIVGLIYSFHRVGYPLFLESSNYGGVEVGLLLALNPLIIVCLQNFIINFTNQLSHIFILSIGLLMFGLSLAVLNVNSSINMILISCIFMTIGEIIATVYSQSIVFGNVPTHKRGLILGIYKTSYSLMGIFGSYLSGWIIYNKSYHLLWDLCGVIGFIGFMTGLLTYFFIRFLPANRYATP